MEPELKTPYELEIVLDLGKHRQLTPVFRERVERELGDSLQEALGDLARVKVVSKHARLAEVRSVGLQKALDDWKDRSPVKTHFVLIDYSDDNYEIQARQHDGMTGLSSPVVRVDQTRDPDFVAKAAALLVAQDFGVIGTVQLPAKPKEVRVDLKAGGLGSLAGWVKKGDVFELVAIANENSAGRKVPWTLLRVEQAPGSGSSACVCRLFQTWEAPLTDAGVLGYRCIKVETGRFPLRIRVLEAAKAGVPAREKDWPVDVRQHGFDGPIRVHGLTHRNGAFDTAGMKDGMFDRIAFVTIDLGDKKVSQVPIPLVADRVEVVTITAGNDEDGLFRFRKEGWMHEVHVSYMTQNTILQEIKDLTEKPGQRSQALTRARDGLTRFQEDLKRLNEERRALVEQAPAAVKTKLALELTPYDQQLRKVQEGATDLQVFKDRLEKIDRDENDPTRKTLLADLEVAGVLEKQMELGKAIVIVEKVISGGVDTPELREKLAQMKKRWILEIADKQLQEEHKKARTFIYEVWTKEWSSEKLNDLVEQAEKKFAVCKKVGDLVGAKKLYDATIAHAPRLKMELDKLNEVNADEKEKIELIKTLNGRLEKLVQDIDAYLQQAVGVEKK